MATAGPLHQPIVKSGFVALLGRPNAGKSTLLNRIVGRKLAIVSDKPQTTRTRILGVKSYAAGQVAFVDTPGVHRPLHRMNVRMVDAALETMRGVDVVALVVDVSARPGSGDRFLLDLVRPLTVPVVLTLNKVDRVEKPKLLPIIDQYRREREFAEIVPISALDGSNVERFESLLLEYLPEGQPLHQDGLVTDGRDRVRLAEIVREQVLQLTRDELPFSTAVVVDRVEDAASNCPTAVYCTVLVERESQKRIIVGRAGSMIKAIGTGARAELETLFGARVFLDLHVKVKSEWRDNERLLDDLLSE
jgi:GTP-binding protein Era